MMQLFLMYGVAQSLSFDQAATSSSLQMMRAVLLISSPFPRVIPLLECFVEGLDGLVE